MSGAPKLPTKKYKNLENIKIDVRSSQGSHRKYTKKLEKRSIVSYKSLKMSVLLAGACDLREHIKSGKQIYHLPSTSIFLFYIDMKPRKLIFSKTSKLSRLFT